MEIDDYRIVEETIEIKRYFLVKSKDDPIKDLQNIADNAVYLQSCDEESGKQKYKVLLLKKKDACDKVILDAARDIENRLQQVKDAKEAKKIKELKKKKNNK